MSEQVEKVGSPNSGPQNILSEDERLQMRELCKQSLFFLNRAVLGFRDLTIHIHKPVCDELQDPEKTRCIIVIPRTWFKSSIGSIGYPIFRAINDPDSRGLICQNTYSNATKKLSSIGQIFEKNALFRWLFPEILPDSSCQWSSDAKTVKRKATHPEATWEAAGTGTATTSRHYDYIIEDDTVAPEKDDLSVELQQPTAMEIQKAIGWHNLATPLLIHPLRSKIIIIGTRWAEEDLIGHVMDKFPNYHVITRAVREKNGIPATPEEGGVPAWPERFNEDVLHEVETALGPYMFATLMMNMPTSAANQVFRREWIRYYDSINPNNLVCFTSVDPAAADKETSGDPDYSVVLTTGIDPEAGRIYVLGYDRERMNPGQVIDKMFLHYDMYHPVDVLVEGVAYQRTLKYWVEQRQKKLKKFFPISLSKATRASKAERIRAMQPFFSNVMVFLRPHMDILERELLVFPAARGHDDVIDALCMQVANWNDTISQARKPAARPDDNNPLSAERILNELLGRVKKLDCYPYDIGILADRIRRAS